ncbi:hypothetical protein OC846_006409, partial [Tilletia horrida]
KIHIDPVARTQGRDADDCDAYTTILQQCKGTIEELAIAINCSNGDEPSLNVSDSRHQALKRLSKTRMPQLKHLILKYEKFHHLDLIAWNHLESLQDVTVLTGYHVSLDPVDFEFYSDSPFHNHVFWVLMRLPSTVKKLTFGSVFAFEWFDSFGTLHGDISGSYDMIMFADTVAFALKDARKCGKLDHPESIRLIFTYSPDDGDRCDRCLFKDRGVSYPLPRLRSCTLSKDSCANNLVDYDSMGDHEGSSARSASDLTSGRKPIIQTYEIWCPPGSQTCWLEEDNIDTCCWHYGIALGLEVLWRSLLYGSPDRFSDEGVDEEVERLRRCISR